MNSKTLLKTIKDHLKKTGEGPYAWGRRVMRDQTFLWKLQHLGRVPYPNTVKKIDRAIRVREAALARRTRILASDG